MRGSAIRPKALGGLMMLSLGFFGAACAGDPEARSTDTTAASPAPAAAGEADKEFLTKMIGHHSGMLVMAEAAMASATAEAKADAERVHHMQAMEIDSMSAILGTRYATTITPAVSAEARMMSDSLRKLTGVPASRAFYDMTVKHHQEGIVMVDEYLPRLSPEISAMASKMKTDQTAEIAEFGAKAARLE